MITVCQAKLNDIVAIRHIAKATWPVTFAGILSEEQIAYMMQLTYSANAIEDDILKKNHVFLLAKENGKAIGFTCYELNYSEHPTTKIHKIYILPTHQGKGIGKLFFNEISTIAKKNNNNKLTLNVHRDNRAIQFYKHIGFTIDRAEDINIGNGFLLHDYVMNKKL